MITLQHTLVSLLAMNGNEEQLKKEIPYILLPDAIRRYMGPRQYSHFEMAHDGSDVSWVEFPVDTKKISRESLAAAPKHMVAEVKPCVLGETTNLEAYVQHNGHLPPDYFTGVKKHLIQDCIFDAYVRANIDCSRMYEDKFVFDGKEYDGKSIRKVIAEIEEHGVYMLAHMLHEYFGITANQEWFDRVVQPQLYAAYCEDLASGTYQYMKIPEVINERITKGDWSHLGECPLTNESYINMYQFVLDEMRVADYEKMLREETLASEKGEPTTPDESTSNTDSNNKKQKPTGPSND